MGVELRMHPICDAFPEMDPGAFEELARDIAEHGQHVPIQVWNGQVIDGRHRYRACKQLGREPITAEFSGSEAEMILFVASLNSKRRDLKPGQKAAAALEIEKMLAEAAKEKQKADGKKGGRPRKEPAENLKEKFPEGFPVAHSQPVKVTPPEPKAPQSRDKAAEATGANPRYVQDCKTLDAKAPDLLAKVKAGAINPPQAIRELNRREKEVELKAKAEAARQAEEEARKAAEEAGSEAPVRSWDIVVGDCIEVMAGMEAGSVRLAFADPPYNIGIDYGDHVNDSRPADEFQRWCAEWLAGVHRLLSDDGSLWLLVNHEWGWVLAYEAVETVGFHLRQWITWYESFGVNCTGKFNRCSRPLLWLTKSKGRFVFNDTFEGIRRPSDRQAKYNDKRADPAGKLWDDVWGINPPLPRVVDNHAERLPNFPTQLPLAMLRAVVGCASDPHDLVLDPFNGSGTTGAACIELGRRYVGIELGERFAELARLRLEATTPIDREA